MDQGLILKKPVEIRTSYVILNPECNRRVKNLLEY